MPEQYVVIIQGPRGGNIYGPFNSGPAAMAWIRARALPEGDNAQAVLLEPPTAAEVAVP
jgi:hypothetical protein